MNERFKGELYADNDEVLMLFQTAALQSGMAITIMPRGNGQYRIEFLKNDEADR